jgi:hypothetical protein
MTVIDIPTEQSTAVTDLAMALITCACGFVIYRQRKHDCFKALIWLSIFGFLFLASVLGAVAHGLSWAPATRRMIWQPLNLCLGLLMAMFVVAAAYDRWGRRVAMRFLPITCATGVAFFITTLVVPQSFVWFVIFESSGMLFALFLYVTDVSLNRSRESTMIAIGLLLSILAAVVQSMESIRFTLIWQFDNNGAFHFIQILGMLFIAYGVQRALSKRAQTRAFAQKPV